MLIMLLIPRLLVAVVVILIVTNVGVIAWRWPSFSWWTKVPRVIVHSPPIYEQNTYGPFKPDSSGIFGFGQKLSDKYNDGPDLSSENSGFGHNPSDKHKNYQELEKLLMSLRKDRQRSTPPTSDNQKDIFSENSGFGPKHSDSYYDKMEDAFLDFLKEKRTPEVARGRLITSAPVNQKESSTWNFTKTSSDTQFKTPGATVKHNLQEKELQGTKNLGQQQLPAEN